MCYRFIRPSISCFHIRKITGENDHHIIEGMFKAFAKALDEACMKDARIKSVLSTKGSL